MFINPRIRIISMPGPSKRVLLEKERTKFSKERTLWANERTMLSYIRTALAAFLFGIALIKIFDGTQLALFTGIGFLLLGLFFFIAGFVYFHDRRQNILSVFWQK